MYISMQTNRYQKLPQNSTALHILHTIGLTSSRSPVRYDRVAGDGETVNMCLMFWSDMFNFVYKITWSNICIFQSCLMGGCGHLNISLFSPITVVSVNSLEDFQSVMAAWSKKKSHCYQIETSGPRIRILKDPIQERGRRISDNELMN